MRGVVATRRVCCNQTWNDIGVRDNPEHMSNEAKKEEEIF